MDTQYQPVVAEERSGAGTLFRIMDRGAPDLSRGWSTRTKIRSGGRNICPLLCQHCRWIPSRTNPHLSIICHEAVLPAKVSPFSQKLSSTVNTKQARRCRSLFPGRYHRADSHQDDPGQKPSGNSAHCPMKPPGIHQPYRNRPSRDADTNRPGAFRCPNPGRFLSRTPCATSRTPDMIYPGSGRGRRRFGILHQS